jgi:hypothetical protein
MEDTKEDIKKVKELVRRKSFIEGFFMSFFKRTLIIYAIVLINLVFPQAKEGFFKLASNLKLEYVFNLNKISGIAVLGLLTMFFYRFANEFAQRATKKDNGEYIFMLFLLEKTFIVIPVLFLFFIFTN